MSCKNWTGCKMCLVLVILLATRLRQVQVSGKMASSFGQAMPAVHRLLARSNWPIFDRGLWFFSVKLFFICFFVLGRGSGLGALIRALNRLTFKRDDDLTHARFVLASLLGFPQGSSPWAQLHGKKMHVLRYFIYEFNLLLASYSKMPMKTNS